MPAKLLLLTRFSSKGRVPLRALTETVWVLAAVYKRYAKSLATAIAMLLHHEQLVLQDSDAVSAALDLFRSRPSPGFSDCLMLQIARKAGHLPLGTFDRGLAKIEGAQRL